MLSYIVLMSSLTLFIDLCSHRKVIACVDEEKTIALEEITDHTDEANLLPAIETMLRSIKTTLRDVKRIAAVTGPGGFMSQRVGLSLANTLAWSLKIKVAGVHLSDVWEARLPPSSPNPFSRGEKGEPTPMDIAEEKKAMNPQILKFTRSLRKEATEAEKILWESIRNSQLGFKIRRQHPIRQRILDFYCHESHLGIELDGDIHEQAEQALYDQERTEALADLGIRIIRFKNEEVFHDLPMVIARIKESLHSPLPSGEGSGVRVVWLHSTQKSALFIRGFGQCAQTWPEATLISLEDAQRSLSPLGGEGEGVGVIGELIPEHQKIFTLVSEKTLLPIDDVLPALCGNLPYGEPPILPWYGRGL